MTLADRIGVLAEGRLIQVGTPQQIYSEPDSLYVACRLGSPQINQIPVGALGLTAAPAATKTIGLRPEDVQLGRGEQAAKILAVEPQGAETVVLLEAEGEELHALAGPGQRLSPGDDTRLEISTERCIFFDGDGRRIAAEEASHVG